ncbi:type II toxin-antitoxin system HipA family toxin [bacterium]|nr:type II toxin-antitoxin system HipA family toxin [bacterium]NBW58456.1 type II toxin-antitoxin system HipA family toxin [bacterium]NBX71373.1 type II toxin-antitoxin system HipA family toxin [bacterium]
MSNKQYLVVRLNQKPIGTLVQTATGKKEFFYSKDALHPISLSMPLCNEVYKDIVCESFFGGYLPEHPEVKMIIGKKYGISPNNTFSMLKAIGGDCAGALSFHDPDDVIDESLTFEITGKEIDAHELERMIDQLKLNPLFLGINNLRLSLAGFQDKAAVCLWDNKVIIPSPGIPTTHILKPTHPVLNDLAENEYLIMRIAKQIGINVPEVILRNDFKKPFLLVTRYDRVIEEGRISRVHQEDFCQALAISGRYKYQNEGGPGFNQCYELINKLYLPAVEKLKFTELVVFNVLIGNMDAHGKNFSILHKPDHVCLTPFYDLVSTKFYENLSQKMAMKIGKTYKTEELTRIQWEKFSKEIQYSFSSLCKLIEKTAEKISLFLDKKDDVVHAGPLVDYLRNHIDKQIKLLYQQTRW